MWRCGCDANCPACLISAELSPPRHDAIALALAARTARWGRRESSVLWHRAQHALVKCPCSKILPAKLFVRFSSPPRISLHHFRCNRALPCGWFFAHLPSTYYLCNFFLSPPPSPDVTQIRGRRAGSPPSSTARAFIVIARIIQHFLPLPTCVEVTLPDAAKRFQRSIPLKNSDPHVGFEHQNQL